MDDILKYLQDFASENLVTYAYNIVAALVIFIIGKWIASRVAAVSRNLFSKKIDVTVANFIANIINIAILAFVVIAALDRLGVETTSIVAIVGAAGLAVGLALKDSLGNFAAGVMLIIFRPFKAGDYVEAGGAAGTVQEVRIFNSIFITPDNKVITIPNGAIMAGNIVNYSERPTRRVDMVVGVGYGSDLATVKQVISAILDADKRVLRDPAPTIAVSELADSSVNLVVRPWVKSADYWAVMWDTTEAIKTRFDAEGIEIPFPQVVMHQPASS
ncbi:MAG: mechanosensitive ion channel [Alcanivoracaceae bacterium]|jgi:small conductance mechanosensitive channel|nr:mechanosensitive ion channel [Alcanivoracaceae bacterium]